MDIINQFFSATPSIALMQSGLTGVAVILVFLVLFTTRDILLRSNSFLYQLFCIVIVAGLPVIGFMLYLLIRPARTRKQREMHRDVQIILERLQGSHQQHHSHTHHPKKKNHHSASSAPGFTMKSAKEKA